MAGTFVPVSTSFLLNRRHSYDDRIFFFSWLLWLLGAGFLIACVWSVRTILLQKGHGRRPVWLYRIFGWLSLAESLIWLYTVARVI